MELAAEALKLCLALALVAGLAWAAFKAPWRGLGPKGRMSRLRVVEAVGLGRQRLACILEVDGRWFLLGVSDGAVTLLKELGIRHDDVKPRHIAGNLRAPDREGPGEREECALRASATIARGTEDRLGSPRPSLPFTQRLGRLWKRARRPLETLSEGEARETDSRPGGAGRGDGAWS